MGNNLFVILSKPYNATLSTQMTCIVGCVIKIKMSFELWGEYILVCMYIVKWKNAFSEKFGLFYLPGSSPENLTGPLKSGFSSCSDYPVDGTLKLCHETLITDEKELVWSEHSVPRKRQKRAKMLVIFNDCQIQQKYEYFGTEYLD